VLPFPETQAVSDIIRTTLGPRSMLKMILDASGGASRPARAIARRPEARSAWALSLQTKRRGKVKRQARALTFLSKPPRC
jgi:hypothetical protein